MDVLGQHNLDLIAIIWFVALIGGYRIVAAWSPLERRSIVGAVQRHRIAWMRNMAIRDNRTLGFARLDASGSFDLYVGGRLNVNANQQVGTYSGTFDVTVLYL